MRLPDAELSYFPGFFSAQESGGLLASLMNDIEWRQDTLNFGGRKIPVPRLQAWYGERRYAYSGLRLEPLPWTPLLIQIRDRISTATGLPFNSVLLNCYRDGIDSVAWHSDDERELGPDPRIASLSFGAERRFDLRHRVQKAARHSIVLETGSLLMMGTGVQKHWMHQLPKDRSITAPRVNLTFRFIH